MTEASVTFICAGLSDTFPAFSQDESGSKLGTLDGPRIHSSIDGGRPGLGLSWEKPKVGSEPTSDSVVERGGHRYPPNCFFEASPAAWGFAFRSGLAACLGLYVAFFTQMEDPYWAAISAMIVSNPNYDKVLHRGLFRIAGSFVGFLVALFLAAAFSQEPVFFLVSLALWVGTCVALARMLPDAQAFGVAGAGFTTAIITLAVISDQPLSIFNTAIERLGDIIVGIGASIVISGLLKPNGAVASSGSLLIVAVVPIQNRLLELEQGALDQETEDVPAIIREIRKGFNHIQTAFKKWLDWKAGRTLNPSGSTEYYRNGYDALLNGVRCFIAILSASLFWIFTQWPNGPGLVTIASIVSCFLLIQDDPLSVSMPFLWGVVWLVPAGIVYNFLVLPQIFDFIPLAVATSLFVMPAGLAASSLDPQTSLMGRAYMFLFFSVTTIGNTMVFDFSKYINNAVSTLGGVALVLLSVYLIRSPIRKRREPGLPLRVPAQIARFNPHRPQTFKGAS
jgi:uncharacterized membrane protein YccC